MKHFRCPVLLFLLLISGLSSPGQSLAHEVAPDTASYPYWIGMMQDPAVNFYAVQRAFDLYWHNRPVTRGDGWKVFKRWEYMMQQRIAPDGTRPAPDATFEAWEAYSAYTESLTGTWTSLGPSQIPAPGPPGYLGLGRLNVIAFHPTDANMLYVGAPSGGFWKTTNGGLNWITTTDNLPTLGVSAIVADFANPSKILIGTGDRDAGDAPGLGVFVSTDGGNTWTQSNTGMGTKTVGKLLQHPTTPSTYLAASSGGVYRSTDGGANWSLSISGNFKDICFKPNDPLTVYASKDGAFFRSTNNGVTFTQITAGLTTGQRGAIAVTAANPNYVYFLQSNSSSGFKGLYRSSDAGQTFTTRSTAPNILDWSCTGSGTGGQGWYDLALAADPINQETIYAGGINVWKSTNGGSAWSINSHWYGGCSVDEVHADCHYLAYSPVNGTLWACNDGGVYFTTNGGLIWTDRTETMTIGQIYKIGQSQTVPAKVINGFQDNGTYTRNASGWDQTGGGDGMECAIDYNNAAYTYHTIYYGDIYRRFNNGNELHIAGNGTFGINESGAWITPFILSHSDSKMMFVGFKNVWRCNDVRTTNSPVWIKISDNLAGSNSNNMAVLEQSPANTDILYAARYGNKLFRTDNCMVSSPTWIDLTSFLPATGTPTDLAAHPTDPNTVYMTFGTGVYKSTDKGQSWTNISGSLPAVQKNTIVCYPNTPDGLYVGTDAGVYYQDLSTGGWIAFSNGLPVNAEITELEIYLDSDSANLDVISASSYGRGLWQSDMFVNYTTDFEADTTVICAGENISFTDLSSGSPNSWSWSFPGGTPSSSSLQNPQGILYGSAGTYDVTLTTQWNSYFVTTTKSGYIAVTGIPAPPATPDGDTTLCVNNPNTTYTTPPVTYATSYTWVLTPDTAGTLLPAGASVTVDWAANWTGYAFLKVQATGTCGTSAFSPELETFTMNEPGQPLTPFGPNPLCQNNNNTDYTTSPAPNASSYEWNLDPATAGVITGTGTTGTADWDSTFAGDSYIKVRSVNACGESSWSDPYLVSVFPYPIITLGNDTTITYTDTLLLDAGNTGANFLWSNGDTTQTTKAYYTGWPFTVYWAHATVNSCMGEDEIRITFTDPASVPEHNPPLAIRILPNPNRGTFILEINSPITGEVNILILNILGQPILEQFLPCRAGINRVEILVPGATREELYYLRVRKEDQIVSDKIMIIR